MLARLLLVATAVVWGWGFVATKLLLDYLTPVELLLARLAIGLPCLGALVLLRRSRLRLGRRDALSLGAGGLLLAGHFLIQITGMKYTSATNTGWIITSTPLVVAALSALLLRERLGRGALLGLGLATVGILLLVSRGSPARLGWLRHLGDWLVLASAVTWAIYTVVMRDLLRRADPLPVTLAVFAPTLVVSVAWVLLAHRPFPLAALPARGWVALLFLGVLGTALAHWWWQAGLAAVGAARAGVFLYLEPLATTALAVPYLGEPFGAGTAVGGLLVLLGVHLASRR